MKEESPGQKLGWFFWNVVTCEDKSNYVRIKIILFKRKEEISMQTLPNCPKCTSEYTYEDGALLVCPECAHEWAQGSEESSEEVVKDVNGNVLVDGDAVTVIKDLKVKGSSSSIKIGTKVKKIRVILDSPDGHNIDCKIDGFGAMKLKSEFVKKA